MSLHLTCASVGALPGKVIRKTSNMKIVIITICLLCSILLQGQDYYKTAFNKGGDSLKSSLNQIIKNHIEFPYTSSSTDVWDILTNVLISV